jgi:hypothetical protein
MRRFISMDDVADTVRFAAMVIGLYGLLRASEYIHKAPYGCILLRCHVTFGDGFVTLHLSQSKTDVFREGVDVVLHANGGPLCPVRWLRYAMACAPRKDANAPVFQLPSGGPITYTAYQSFISNLCRATGLAPGRFSSHSLRSGGATSLMALGFPPTTVQAVGRWTSDAFKVYIHEDPSLFARVSKSFASAAEDVAGSPLCGLSVEEFAKVNSSTFSSFGERYRHLFP